MNSYEVSDLHLIHDKENPNYFILGQELVYSDLVTGEKYVVPRGFRTNLLSSPMFLWAVLPPHGKYAPAAVLHDYHYDLSCTCEEIDRKKADKIFKRFLKNLEIHPLKIELFYHFVRILGKFKYKTEKNLNGG